MKSESEVAQSCLTLGDPWTVAHQAPPSMGFSKQEYWSGLPFPSPGDLPNPGIEPRSPTLRPRCFNLCTTREALKYKNTVSQKTSYRDTELQIKEITQVFKDFKGRKGSQVERRRGRRRERGTKGVALQTSPVTCRFPGIMGLYPGPPEKGGLELGSTRNQTRPEPEFSAKRR